MSNDAINWAWRQTLPYTSKYVLVYLANRANTDGRCWPTLATMGLETGLSRPALVHHIAALEDAGLVAHERRGGAGNGAASNVYQLNFKPHDMAKLTSARAKLTSARTLLLEEPTINPHTKPTREPTARAPQPQKPVKQDKPSIEEITAELIALYADIWPPVEVQARVDRALNHKASDKWKDKSRGLKDWLRRDAAEARSTSPPHRNGNGTPAGRKGPLSAALESVDDDEDQGGAR